MIVVAIIGILSAIAIPNYNKYQSKARQVEAKIALAALYVGERSTSVEINTYSACISDVGMGPDLTSQPGLHFYAYGFSTNSTATPQCGADGKSSCAGMTLAGGGIRPCTYMTQYSAPFGTYVLPTPLGVGAGSQYQVSANAAMDTGNLGANTALDNSNYPEVSTLGFTAAAVGSISRSPTNAYDIWTMDDSKTLSNAQSGI